MNDEVITRHDVTSSTNPSPEVRVTRKLRRKRRQRAAFRRTESESSEDERSYGLNEEDVDLYLSEVSRVI